MWKVQHSAGARIQTNEEEDCFPCVFVQSSPPICGCSEFSASPFPVLRYAVRKGGIHMLKNLLIFGVGLVAGALGISYLTGVKHGMEQAQSDAVRSDESRVQAEGKAEAAGA